jgi:oxygen-independent coproporphyrinogen-3 oxidase
VDGARRATATERGPERWAALVESRGHGLAEVAPLTPAEEADEALLMGLRLTEGIDLERLGAMTGLAPRESAVADLARSGLIARRPGNRIAATAAGRIVLDQVVLRLSSALEDAAVGSRA